MSNVSIQQVAERVAEFYGLDVKQLNQRGALPEESPVKKARDVAIYLVDKHCKPNIRQRVVIFGQGNSNFVNAVGGKIDQLIAENPQGEIPDAIDYLEEQLGLHAAEQTPPPPPF